MSGIYDITKFTMLDYQNHLSCIIWLSGCNMRCQYCHNPQIALAQEKVSVLEYQDFLKSRVGKLEAVVFSGGEATLCKQLPNHMSYAKSLGFKIKLDTNGTNPKMLEELISKNLLDYVALDYKAPEYKFKDITKCNHWNKFKQSLLLLVKSNVKFEVRTTWHTDLLTKQDINLILADLLALGYDGHYYLQKCNQVADSNVFEQLSESQEISLNQINRPQNIKVEIR